MELGRLVERVRRLGAAGQMRILVRVNDERVVLVLVAGMSGSRGGEARREILAVLSPFRPALDARGCLSAAAAAWVDAA